MVLFTGCKKGDLRDEGKGVPRKKGKKKEYIEIDEENTGSQSVIEKEGVGYPGATAGLECDLSNHQSPAAHSSDEQTWVAFLCTLSQAQCPECQLTLEPCLSWKLSYSVPHKSTPPLQNPLQTKSAFSALRSSASLPSIPPLLRPPFLYISAFSLTFSFLCLDFLSFTSLTDV
ncbi:hypothetical protein PAXRUDRAFT_22086 [Paxillus rubicundulus Ve08.2h10]|uniref:Unplaced genomic scaffold scaffold_6104, whole genome shotgun sequence n=1 Tax=Paxillus rubicundulus Ve08.2h10 TaxID=930991 RepID=A0A0D0CY66_9AGAM|nr:hypothetical protein PAXRUDRAFT_22086 [Paxillus rubicundulus Ve08.2h10]